MAALIVPAVAAVAAVPARAYGNTALFQVAVSANCDNRKLCGAQGSVGGFWIWAEIDAGGTGNATITDCAHFRSTRPFGSAQHVNEEFTWTIAPGSAGPDTVFLTSEVDTFTGHTGGAPVTITIPSEMFDTGVPAVAGHYSTLDVLGFTAPGVSFQIQVVSLA